MIQITPQMRILVAIEAVDGRKGIDSLARLCEEKLQADPFSGSLFVFRSRRGTSIRILVYDGRGVLAGTKAALEGEIYMVAERRGTSTATRSAPRRKLPVSRRQPGDRSGASVAQSKLKKPQQKTCVLLFSLACCGYGGNMALPGTRNR